ncbi:MAG TPA: hypothetical protein PLL06_01055 [Acidobacteriota bacterium]|nr:hypothetical protein [Acidobacteriota bacterium]HNG92889.1 hypothetical protein [Acidobacteriota bacterium]
MSSKKLYLVELSYRVYAWAESEDLALDAAVDAIASLDAPHTDQFIEVATAVHYGDENNFTVGEPPSDLPPRATLEELVKLQAMDLAEERRLAELKEEFNRRQKGLF